MYSTSLLHISIEYVLTEASLKIVLNNSSNTLVLIRVAFLLYSPTSPSSSIYTDPTNAPFMHTTVLTPTTGEIHREYHSHWVQYLQSLLDAYLALVQYLYEPYSPTIRRASISSLSHRCSSPHEATTSYRSMPYTRYSPITLCPTAPDNYHYGIRPPVTPPNGHIISAMSHGMYLSASIPGVLSILPAEKELEKQAYHIWHTSANLKSSCKIWNCWSRVYRGNHKIRRISKSN